MVRFIVLVALVSFVTGCGKSVVSQIEEKITEKESQYENRLKEAITKYEREKKEKELAQRILDERIEKLLSEKEALNKKKELDVQALLDKERVKREAEDSARQKALQQMREEVRQIAREEINKKLVSLNPYDEEIRIREQLISRWSKELEKTNYYSSRGVSLRTAIFNVRAELCVLYGNLARWKKRNGVAP